MSFEVGASRALRALHRLAWGTEGERQPHAHDYRIEVVVGREGLDDRGVVCDLDVLGAGLQEGLGRLEGQDLDQIQPPEADGAPVEPVPRWLHGELAAVVRRAGGQTLAVRVWRAADVFAVYRAPVGWPRPA